MLQKDRTTSATRSAAANTAAIGRACVRAVQATSPLHMALLGNMKKPAIDYFGGGYHGMVGKSTGGEREPMCSDGV